MASEKTQLNIELNFLKKQAEADLKRLIKELQSIAKGKKVDISIGLSELDKAKVKAQQLDRSLDKLGTSTNIKAGKGVAANITKELEKATLAYQNAANKISKYRSEINNATLKGTLDTSGATKALNKLQEPYRQFELLRKKMQNEIARNSNQTLPYSFSAEEVSEANRLLQLYGNNYANAFKAIGNQVKTLNTDFKQNFTLSKAMSAESVKINNIGLRIASYMQRFSASLKSTGMYSQFEDLLGRVNMGEFKNFNSALNAFSSLQRAARDAGVEVDNYGEKLSRTLGSRIRSDLAGISTGFMITGLTDLYRNVVNVDTAMTELKKVTDETAATYDQFTTNAIARSKQIGAVLSETINATADYARLGYNIKDASTLADSSLIYLNVGDDLQGIDDASSSLISTMQGFGLEAENSMHIVDAFNEVSNRYATSAGEIGEGVKRSAAAMSAAGNSLEQTIGLFTGAQTVVQDADVVGTALKTMSMRLRSSKTDLALAGEDTEGMATSVSKLREEILALTGVDIMLDENTFKSSYDMLKDLSEVWHDLSDITQANINLFIQ